MLIGYARVSKADGSQSLDRQRDALRATGVDAGHVYHDFASGVRASSVRQSKGNLGTTSNGKSCRRDVTAGSHAT